MVLQRVTGARNRVGGRRERHDHFAKRAHGGDERDGRVGGRRRRVRRGRRCRLLAGLDPHVKWRVLVAERDKSGRHFEHDVANGNLRDSQHVRGELTRFLRRKRANHEIGLAAVPSNVHRVRQKGVVVLVKQRGCVRAAHRGDGLEVKLVGSFLRRYLRDQPGEPRLAGQAVHRERDCGPVGVTAVRVNGVARGDGRGAVAKAVDSVVWNDQVSRDRGANALHANRAQRVRGHRQRGERDEPRTHKRDVTCSDVRGVVNTGDLHHRGEQTVVQGEIRVVPGVVHGDVRNLKRRPDVALGKVDDGRVLGHVVGHVVRLGCVTANRVNDFVVEIVDDWTERGFVAFERGVRKRMVSGGAGRRRAGRRGGRLARRHARRHTRSHAVVHVMGHVVGHVVCRFVGHVIWRVVGHVIVQATSRVLGRVANHLVSRVPHRRRFVVPNLLRLSLGESRQHVRFCLVASVGERGRGVLFYLHVTQQGPAPHRVREVPLRLRVPETVHHSVSRVGVVHGHGVGEPGVVPCELQNGGRTARHRLDGPELRAG